MSKHLRLLIVAALLVGVLVTTAGPSAQARDKVKIVLFIGLGTGTNPEQIDTQNAVADAFNASQDAITLELNIAGSNQTAPDVLATLIASGTPPDIVGPVGFAGSNQFAGAVAGPAAPDRSHGLQPGRHPRQPGGLLPLAVPKA